MTTQANKNSKNNQKTEAEKQATREARMQVRMERISAAARKAGKWEQAHGLANMAGAHERAEILKAADTINEHGKHGKKWQASHADELTHATTYIREAVRTLATPDLRAVLAAVPAHVLAKAVRADGSLKVSTIAREMATEMAKNPEAALAVAHAAADAQRKAARKARKAAKKAEAQAQGKAGVK